MPFQELSEAELTARELLDPFDPDLPPSRTQRKPAPARSTEPPASDWDRFRTETPPTELPDEREWPERRTSDLENEASGGRRGGRGARPRGRVPVPPPQSPGPKTSLPSALQPRAMNSHPASSLISTSAVTIEQTPCQSTSRLVRAAAALPFAPEVAAPTHREIHNPRPNPHRASLREASRPLKADSSPIDAAARHLSA